MTTAQTEPTEIPASRIMRERDQARLTVLDLRGLLAMTQTDRNRFERERDEARAALTVSRNTLDDLTDHCTRQGGYIARLQSEVMEIAKERAEFRGMLIDALQGPSGKDCPDCCGTGEVADEAMDGDPGASLGYSIRQIMGTCESCFGHGRVLR